MKSDMDVEKIIGEPFEKLNVEEMTKIQGAGVQTVQSTPWTAVEGFTVSLAISNEFGGRRRHR
ncbi:lichenicidin A2 family type 2 lantibiotic [Limosilactobacillus reuteri]|uniref:lichenicidin A2 family type 2 lantibiotic n=1 Tax=Limosilactobacillus reuteri TaxID=1598 RepID=UPI00128B1D51|nr:lichenicidin A2 family type 2 lantibiotic [Limosilactobacillus reuteri]MCC4358751.1 lichenicidin A2 family type 2 lantibiotic [Limosilactobacillus reuteri]MCC4363429.1 lichenicidin A2 family type 2 lantibiotic [Limosilactobacillus reuteri]MCC4365231.1 lichenicidin A2 family type 2 lantibiotic [Limosilactobacillus reuteri]MCC4368964.1 lichenicidin A2 family type 2 lantibiotic [Limosilactobacillus reuteri]MQB77221.1 type 2 lantibiotic [Limosilactobacillus reuteri]